MELAPLQWVQRDYRRADVATERDVTNDPPVPLPPTSSTPIAQRYALPDHLTRSQNAIVRHETFNLDLSSGVVEQTLVEINP